MWLADLLDNSDDMEVSPPKEDSTLSRHGSAGSLPRGLAPETWIFCVLPKKDCIATQDTFYFQCFFADLFFADPEVVQLGMACVGSSTSQCQEQGKKRGGLGHGTPGLGRGRQ